MKFIPSNIGCPSCQGAMVPVVVRCEACELEVKGNFKLNEFASLSPEDLHFLRIFVHCEGGIREMESALGVSYPTIKGKLAKLKASLGERDEAATGESGAAGNGEQVKDRATEVLRDLEAGKVSFGEAMKRIRGNGRGEGAV